VEGWGKPIFVGVDCPAALLGEHSVDGQFGKEVAEEM
jgi:hypothetical protein